MISLIMVAVEHKGVIKGGKRVVKQPESMLISPCRKMKYGMKLHVHGNSVERLTL